MARLGWSLSFLSAALTWAVGMALGWAFVGHAEQLAFGQIVDDIPERAALPQAATAEQGAAPVVSAERGDGALFLFILGRNVAVYVWLLAGLLSAGAVTFVILLYNSVQLGVTIGFASRNGMDAQEMAYLLLPHGVLEVGAFFIAGAVGYQGLRLVMEWSRGAAELIKGLRLGVVCLYGACALTVAAAVEVFVTVRLAGAHAVAG